MNVPALNQTRKPSRQYSMSPVRITKTNHPYKDENDPHNLYVNRSKLYERENMVIVSRLFCVPEFKLTGEQLMNDGWCIYVPIGDTGVDDAVLIQARQESRVDSVTLVSTPSPHYQVFIKPWRAPYPRMYVYLGRMVLPLLVALVYCLVQIIAIR